MAIGDCCTARHANAVSPWTCDCPCHDAKVGTRLDGDTVPILRGDVEAIIDIIEQYVDCPEVWDECLKRLRTALE